MQSILQNMRLGTRLRILCAMALMILATIGALSLHDLRQSMLEERQAKVRAQVETAVGIVTHFQQLAQSGKLSTQDAQSQAAAALRDVRYDGHEYFFIINTDLVYQMHPIKPEFVGQYKGDLKDVNGVMILQELLAAARQGGGFSYFHFTKPGEKEPKPKIAYAQLVKEWNWIVCSGVYEDDINQAFLHKLLIAALQFSVLALLLGWVAWAISRSILQQLGGEPQEAMAIMNEVAAGNLQTQIQAQYPNSLLSTLNTMVRGLRQTLAAVQNHAGTLSQQSGQIACSSKSVAQAASQQADATTSMAAAMEELTVSISHISDNSSITEQSAIDATQLARSGVTQVGDATQAMELIAGRVDDATQQIQALDSKAREISGIAAVIKDIAGQTNLLALNAAIEAARAGEQGRGFAVVADEVRKLAERTANATIDIERMLLTIQGDTEHVVELMHTTIPEVEKGVQLARQVSDSLQRIHRGAESTLAHLQEVASATREQSVASNSIAVRVEDISQMVEETSVAIDHAADGASQVEHIASELKQMVARFKI